MWTLLKGWLRTLERLNSAIRSEAKHLLLVSVHIFKLFFSAVNDDSKFTSVHKTTGNMEYDSSLWLIPSFQPPSMALGRNQSRFDRTKMLLESLTSPNSITFKEADIHCAVGATKSNKRKLDSKSNNVSNELSLFDGMMPIDSMTSIPNSNSKQSNNQTLPNRFVSSQPTNLELKSSQFISNVSLLDGINNNHRPLSASSVESLDFMLKPTTATQSKGRIRGRHSRRF